MGRTVPERWQTTIVQHGWALKRIRLREYLFEKRTFMSRLSLTQKLMAVVGLAAGLPALACCALLLVEYTSVDDKLTGESETLVRGETSRIAKDVYLLLRSQDEFSRQKLRADLAVALHMFAEAGSLSFGPESVEWRATNQYTNQGIDVRVPQMRLGDVWLGQNVDRLTPSLVVDPVRELVGGTCTIFQRINDAGDMLRVCTNVETLGGTRAIGTYIPAIDPSGKPDPVIKSLIEGKTYVGKAFVVNAYYLSAYEPIFDQHKRVVGAIYVGVKLESVRSVRAGIADIVVGDHGSAMILGGLGKDKGKCLISHQAQSDGEDMMDNRDADNRPYVQQIVDSAVKLMGDEIAFTDFVVARPEGGERQMVAAFAYFRPWDWVIVVSADIADYQGMIERTEDAVLSVLGRCLVLVLGLSTLLLVLACIAGRHLAGRLNRLADGMEDVRKGDFTFLAPGDSAENPIGMTVESVDKERDEIVQLETSFRLMALGTRGLFATFYHSSQGLFGQVSKIPSIQGNGNAPAHVITQGSGELTAVIRDLSRESQRLTVDLENAVRHASDAIDALGAGSESLAAMDGSVELLSRATNAISVKLDEIHDRASEIDDVLAAIVKVTEQTNLLAINAAIEAEKAGEFGLGFLVIAREIRRLSDQTSVAAQGIEKKVAAMHSAVSSGVMAMDKLADAVRRGSKETESVVRHFPSVVEQIEQLRGDLEQVAERLASHSRRAHDAVETTAELVDKIELVAGRVRDFSSFTRDLQLVADEIQDSIGQVKLE